MLEQIKKMLVNGVDGEKILNETAGYFYETVEEKKKDYPVLELMLFEYETLQAYFQAENETFSLQEREQLLDMKEDIEYYLEDVFDQVEDDVKHQLLHGSQSAAVLADVRAQGIIPAHQHLHEDELEEIYMEAFQQLDLIRYQMLEQILNLSPQEFYRHGQAQIEAYRQAHGLLMDAQEFNAYYGETFDKERLWNLLARKVYETIHFNQHYIIEDVPEEEDETIHEWEDSSDTEEESDDRQDAVLVGDGDLKPERYTFIYELMSEYTGKRVLPSENELGEEAYWTTYHDDFSEILGLFMIAQLENTIHHFAHHHAVEYDTFARFYHWDQDQRQNPEVILASCDRISYYLSDLQEALWTEFAESKLLPIYERGKDLYEKSKSGRRDGE